MARIEELPDDFDESVNINDGPLSMSSLDDVYAQRAKERDQRAPEDQEKVFAETLKSFSKTPLFMDNLDIGGSAGRCRSPVTAYSG